MEYDQKTKPGFPTKVCKEKSNARDTVIFMNDMRDVALKHLAPALSPALRSTQRGCGLGAICAEFFLMSVLVLFLTRILLFLSTYTSTCKSSIQYSTLNFHRVSRSLSVPLYYFLTSLISILSNSLTRKIMVLIRPTSKGIKKGILLIAVYIYSYFNTHSIYIQIYIFPFPMLHLDI